MNMPGFAAEASLDMLEGSHRIARAGAGNSGETGIAIVPQSLPLHSLCWTEIVVPGFCNPCVGGKQECFMITRWCCPSGLFPSKTCGPLNWVDLGSQPCQ
jgi:hypothetical protein